MELLFVNILLLIQDRIMEDPGVPGGDPDLPEVPLDSGLFVLIGIALVCGIWRLRQMNSMQERP